MQEIKNHLTTFVGDLRVSFLDLATIIGVIAFFQFVVLRTVPENWFSMLIGLAIVGVGLALFMRGLEIGIFPLGEDLAKHLASASSRVWLIIFAFIIGFATTIAEPALIAVAHKAAVISDGQIDALILRLVVALSVGVAIVIGVIRILLDHPIHWYIIAGYVGVMFVTYFAPQEIVGLAYDSGGVTTSTVTVPLVVALGVGLASTLKNRNPIIDGFGLIAFASLMPMIFVQVYGIFAYSLGGAPSPASLVPAFDTSAVSSLAAATALASKTAGQYLAGFVGTMRDIAPIVISILFFYLVILRKPIQEFSKRATGVLFILFGLYAFVIGLEVGLFPIGETIAAELAKNGNVWLIYLFAFTVGFATTIAEPALTAIARKAEEVSGRVIKALALRIFVAAGVGIGILLGAYRIVQGDSIVLYILVGYVVVVLLTYFAPRTIIPIAYDSGGVTTSTVTVPIVAALGLGLAAAIPGRDPLIDGFGLIAFASLFPMISVLGYGISETERIRRHERKIAELESHTFTRVLGRFKKEGDKKAEEELKKKRRLRKQIVTITGVSGSGVSSAAREVARRLHFRYFSSGDLLRKIAKEYEVSIEKLNTLAEDDEAIDREVDELTRELGQYSSQVVIDSRLGYHWIHDSFKVYLTVDREKAAERVFTLTRKGERVGERAETVQEIHASMAKRAESQKKRYQENYGIDITNTKPFTLIIDTGKHDVETVATMIVNGYREWYGES